MSHQRRQKKRRRRILHPYSRPHVGLLDGMFNINLSLISAVRVLQDSPTGHQHHGGQHYGQTSLQRNAVQSLSIHSNVITWQAAGPNTTSIQNAPSWSLQHIHTPCTSYYCSTSGKSCTTQTSQATTTQVGDQPGEPTAQMLAACPTCPPTCKQPSLTRLLKAAPKAISSPKQI